LEPHPLVAEPLGDGVFERRHSGGRERLLVTALTGLGRLPGTDPVDIWRYVQGLAGMLANVAQHLVYLLAALEDVDLVDDHQHLATPRRDQLEELALALGERPVGAGDEQQQVGSWDEALG